MPKQRLVNCDFINDMTKVSNKAKFLYLMLFVNADDKGFVGNSEEIIKSLNNNDQEYRNEINLELLDNDYVAALNELISKGLIYEFNNNHNNRVYLIRHWYYHNKLKQGLWTNYYKYSKLVEVVDNEYVFKKSKTKEEDKLNQDKLNEIKLTNNLTDNSNNKATNIDDIEITRDDLPF